MAKELVLTQEELDLIEKRRLREARKNKKQSELVKQAFAKLPTFAAFLKIIGVDSSLETSREQKTTMHDVHVTTDGSIAYKGDWYHHADNDPTAIPVYLSQFDSIQKICGKKIPFQCRLNINIAMNKVVGFSLVITDDYFRRSYWIDSQICYVSVLQDNYGYIKDLYGDRLFKLDKTDLRAELIAQIQKVCSELVKRAEGHVLDCQTNLDKALESRKTLKEKLGVYYKPAERKED